MLRECKLLAVLNEGLIRLSTAESVRDYGPELWTKVKIRKARKCTNCDSQIPVGASAFSPITHGYNRMHRICMGCVGRLGQQ